MEMLINFIVGLILVPAYNGIKNKLGLKDTAAAWVLLFIALGFSFPIAMFNGALGNLEFNLADPLGTLEAVGQGFLILLGTAEGMYMLVKQRDK